MFQLLHFTQKPFGTNFTNFFAFYRSENYFKKSQWKKE